MRKLAIFSLLTLLVCLIFFGVKLSRAQSSDIEIIPNATEHTVVMPYEKSFLFTAKIKNNSSQAQRIETKSETEDIPQNWHALISTGRYQLAGGEEADFIAVFEPGLGPELEQPKEETVTVPISFTWEGGSRKIEVTTKTKTLELPREGGDISRVKFSVLDKSTDKPISGTTTTAMLPSGMEKVTAEGDNGFYILSAPSGTYLAKLVKEYQINHKNIGYYLQVTAPGYKGYFEENFLPKDEETKTVALEPLTEVAEYKLAQTVNSGYSIWWIRASNNEQYFAISQGAHENPGQELPDQAKVLLIDRNGKKLWENTTGGECWGLDIAPSGESVSAGCHDGKIYLWNKEGKNLWTYENFRGQEDGGRVRWVKFSPDSQYLLTGPVKDTAEESGLFEVSSGKLLWSFYTGDWLREARFSSDGKTSYLSSANGTIYALETETGKQKWLGTGEYVIPFILGIGEQSNTIVSAGKGRAFTALNLENGTRLWQTVVDQTITAGKMAADGSVVGSTVGGMSYGHFHLRGGIFLTPLVYLQ